MLAAELENEMAEMAEGEGDEQDFEDEMADVGFCFLFCYCNLCYVIVEHLKMTKKNNCQDMLDVFRRSHLVGKPKRKRELKVVFCLFILSLGLPDQSGSILVK